ncbi:MAG: leucine-rich repeat protein, partial [Dehalococcoidia bacterium]|nr:leucine-rich repeat protein [Dehalococcoidia bacterium]
VTVRVTVTDPGGLSVSLESDYLVHWDSYPEVVSATASGAEIELTFDVAVEDDPAPAAGQFTVNVFSGDGTTGTVSVSQVSVSGNVVTLELASELAEGQAVTVDYANDYDTPLQRAGGGGPAPDIDGLAVAPPGPATNFAVIAEPGALDLSATWDAVGGATSYKLRWRQSDKDFEAPNAFTISDTNATITVSDDGQWEVQLQGCNDAGCGSSVAQQVEVDSGQLRVVLTASPAHPVAPKTVIVQPVISNAPSSSDPSYKWEIAEEKRGDDWRWRVFDTGFVELRIVDYNSGNHGSKAYRVTVSYDTGDSATSDPLVVTWARSQPNRAPVVNELAGNYSDFVGKRTAPRGNPVSKLFQGIFSDPDGDELTYAVTVSDDRSELVEMLGAYETTHRVGIEIDADDNWKAVSPVLPDPLTITVTLTATDTDGLSASVSGDFFTDWDSHPVLVSTTASNQAITLTFDQTVQADPAPRPGQFTVNVVNENGSEGTIEVSSVSVNGAVVTLELESALAKGQRVKLDYDHDDDAPLKRAADGGDSAPGFTGQAVRFPLTDTSSSQVCYRTPQVRDAIMKLIPAASDCAEVTDAQLAAITGDLRLNGRGIQMVRVGDFDGLSNLNGLELQHNRLTSLPQGVFDDLAGLRRLRLNDNRLTELSPDLFASLTGLEHLDLGRNNVVTVPANLLANNPKLVFMSLHNNGLTELPTGLFDRLTNLKTLDLSWNRLRTLPAGLFADLTGMSTLWLDDAVNPRFCERPQAERDSILEQLPAISDCRLVTDGDITHVLASMPPLPLCERTPQVRDAILNMIPDISDCADVTDVHLAAITGTLSLADQEVSTVRIGDFDGLSSLNGLDLQRNALTSLPQGSFRDLSMARWVRLNNNELATLDKGAFSGMEILHEISLHNNSLTSIPAGAFDGLSDLRTLHLHENKLNTDALPAGLFADLTAIETLTRDRATDPLLCEQSWEVQDIYLDRLPDINNCKLVTWGDMSLATRQYMEDEYILPYQDDHPWLHEAWFDIPVKVRVGHHPGSGAWWWFDGSMVFAFPYDRVRSVVYHELAHHYTLHAPIHGDDPTAKLSMLSLWLYQTDRKKQFGLPGHVGESLADELAYWVINGEDAEYLYEETYAVMDNASSQKIPQWFFDTYTSDGSLETVDLNTLWADFRYIQRNTGYIPWTLVSHLGMIFGGYCSDGEGSWALNNSSASNPWVEGGCMNWRPGQLTTTAGGTGELSVSWNAPLQSSSPSINAYVVQWRSGDQDYDTSRQAIVTTLGNLSHTITGLTTGAEYTVRVAAVNQSNIADFFDDLGHSRTAETTANAG